jgi:hypothetical protein
LPSIVIPAHNEAGCIERLLRGLTPLACEAEVVVVCNGCTDDTAARARLSAPWAMVLDLAEASKPSALDAGDAACTSFPRAYIDADVAINASAVRRLFAAARDQTPAVAATPVYDLSSSSLMVRAHYAIWSRMKANTEGIAGTNAMAVSEQGRARFTSWPRWIGDDYFLDGQFGPTEKRRIRDAIVLRSAPLGVLDCISRKARVQQGNADVLEDGLRTAHQGGGLKGALAAVHARPTLAICLPVHVTITLAAQSLASWRRRRGTAQSWYRDRSRRPAEAGSHANSPDAH